MYLNIPHYFVGVDLGQKHDFTAIAVLERRDGGPPHFLTPYLIPKTTYDVRHLERVALGTPYPRVAKRIGAITRAEGLQGRCTVVVDSTGVGAPVVDLLRDADLDCTLIPVTITGGQHAHTIGRGKSVPKRELVATLEVMLEQEELRIAAELGERRRLVEELMAMRGGTTRGGRVSYGASGRAHDDLVLALALACWQAKKGMAGEQGSGRLF